MADEAPATATIGDEGQLTAKLHWMAWSGVTITYALHSSIHISGKT
jgi:hypothetical protein